MRDRGAGARRAHDLDVGRLGVAARERVDRRARALRVALHELVDALGDEQVGERVDGVVERAQLGVDRLALRAGERGQPGGGAAERDRRVVPARGGDARAPAAAQAEPVGDVARPQRLRHARLAGAQLVQQGAGGGDGGVRRLDLRELVGDLLVAARRPAPRLACCWPRSALRSSQRLATAWFAAATWGSRRGDRLPAPPSTCVAPGQDRREAAGPVVAAGTADAACAPLQAAALSVAAFACAASSAGWAVAIWAQQRRVGRLRRVALLPQLAEDLARLRAAGRVATLRSCSAAVIASSGASARSAAM